MKYLNIKITYFSLIYKDLRLRIKSILIKYGLNNYRNDKCQKYDKSIFFKAS